jgi:hypothetical protein
MRGLAVAFLLLFWSSPALPQVNQGEGGRPSAHGNHGLSDNDSGGHAIGSGEIAPEEEAGESGQCTRTGSAGTLGFYACRARAVAFGSAERAIVTFTALLAFSTLLL